ncbi:MAG TPA: hypothetical protein VHJ18_12720 [Streptosporangiaceae bacterium]|nr:hypothetical protein [Streptosporangiaceae bacterium]
MPAERHARLIGRRLPQVDQAGGFGLWLVNRCVEFAEVRSTSDGTVTRFHMRLPGNRAVAGGSGRLAGARAA